MKITVLMGSSGRPVAQSMIVWMPTNVAGIVSGLLKSACHTYTIVPASVLNTKSSPQLNIYLAIHIIDARHATESRNINICIENETHIDDYSAPIAEKISRSRSGPNKAPNFVAFIQRAPYDLSTEGSGGTNHQYASWPNRRPRRQIHRSSLLSRTSDYR